MVAGRIPELFECLVTRREIHGIERPLGNFKIGRWIGKDFVVVDQFRESSGDGFGLARGLLFHLLFVAVEQI